MMELEGWGEYRKLVIATMERLDDDIKGVDRKITDLRNEIAALRMELSLQKFKVGLLGASAGALPGLIAAAVWYFKQGA